MNRREFLFTPLPAAAQTAGPRFIKGICSTIFPNPMPLAEKFAAAKSAGFDAVEIRFGDEINLNSAVDDVKRVGEAALKAKVTIASMWVSDGLALKGAALNHPDPAARARGVEIVKQAIEYATYLNCGALLLVPGRLGSGKRFDVGYQDSWDRISAEIPKVLPAAEKARVLITPENVWSKFLVSPIEMRAFVDQFKSPWLQSHFDVGNIVQYGYPQDWILTLGSRIKRVHLKDFSTKFVDLLEGDVDWKAVMAAFVKVGYRGTMSPEYGWKANEPGQIDRISKAVDKIFAMA
jgi:L-ribulose-5-phosphate 3-epimerase